MLQRRSETLIPPHGVRDPHKFSALISSISRGWRGAPLVKWGNDLITGSHRYAACKHLGWRDTDIPVIDIEDVFAEAGLDWTQLYAEYRRCSGSLDDWQILQELIEFLPAEIINKYGIYLCQS